MNYKIGYAGFGSALAVGVKLAVCGMYAYFRTDKWMDGATTALVGTILVAVAVEALLILRYEHRDELRRRQRAVELLQQARC